MREATCARIETLKVLTRVGLLVIFLFCDCIVYSTTCYSYNFQGCMLVFDVGNKASFEKLDEWAQELYDHGGKGAVVAVIANKCDKLRRQISSEDGQRWATKHGFSYYETSAASKIGVKEMLNGLLSTIIERRMIKPKWIGEETK